jgi:hypothetical protein
MVDLQKPETRERKTSSEDLRRLVETGNLYVVVDSCNLPLMPKKVLELGEQRAISLFRGSPEEDLWDVAPYLVKLDKVLFEWLCAHSLHIGWGILIASKSDLNTLRHHLRHFLRVQEPEGQVWNFRFYDPRVLKLFLSACSHNELGIFFGPVLAYGISEPGIKEATFFQPARALTASEGSPFPTKYPIIFPLRPEHVEALRPQVEANFRQRLMRHLRNERVPGVDEISDNQLEERIRFGIDRARKYEFKWPVNFATFVAFMFRFAPDFDKHPHVHAVLTDSSIDCEYRFNVLVEQISDSEWQEIMRDADLTLWRPAREQV